MAPGITDVYRKFSSMNRLNQLMHSSGGVLILLAAIAVSLVIAILLSSLFELDPVYKYLFLGAVAMTILSIVLFNVIFPFFKKPNYSQLSRRIELFHPQLKDYLSAAVELRRNLKENPEGYSIDLINAVIAGSSRKCANIDFKKCLDKKSLIKKVKYSAVFIITALLIISAYPSGLLFAVVDFTNPSIKIDKPDPFSLEAIPGDITVRKGDDLLIGARVIQMLTHRNGDMVPEEVDFVWSYRGSDKNHSMPMKPLEDKANVDSSMIDVLFITDIDKVNRPFEYYLASSDIRSRKYSVEVIDLPRIINLKQRLDYPRYTHLPAALIDENDGNVIALPGTKVSLTINSSKPVEKGRAVFGTAGEIPLDVFGDSARLIFRVKTDDSYHIEILDSNGLSNPEPIPYRVFVTPDSYPEVEIIQPGGDLLVGEIESLPLIIQAKDDFGFSSLRLFYQVTTSGYRQEPVSIDIPIKGSGETDIAIGYNWELAGFGLIPGDVIIYYAVIADNDRYSGAKTAESKRYSIRLPSLDMILAEFDTRRDENVLELEQIIAGQQMQIEKLTELRREMMRLKEKDWEKSKRVEEAIEIQNQISESLDELQESMSKNIESVEKNKMNSLDIFEKSQRIAELIEEINSPELMEAIEKLREALQKLSQKQLNKALEKFQFSQEEYLEKLERTLEMLKRLRAEQKFDQLKQLADKMAEEQKDISDTIESADSSSLDRLADRQEEVGEDLEAFNKGLDKMAEYNKETPVLPDESLESLKQQADSSGLREDIQKSSENMESGKKSQCTSSCMNASRKLQKMASDMQAMQMQMQSGQNAEIERIVRKAFNDVVFLSQTQEGLIDSLGLMMPRDTLIRNLASPQHSLEKKTLIVREDIEHLYELEPRVDRSLSTDLSTAAGKMQQALNRLEMRSKAASAEQSIAMKYLNRVGFKLLMMMNQNNNPASCSGGTGQGASSPQLSELAQQQQGLNQQAAGMVQQMRRSASNQEMLARMAAEQEAIRQGLRELLQSGNSETPGQLGRLDDLGEEMKKIVDDFERKSVNRNTLKRQERVLSRLLEAQKSLRTQGYKKKRKAETGEDIIRAGPEEIADTRSEIHGKLKRLREALKENYPMEYRTMIKAYIDALTAKISTGEQ